MLEWVRNGNAYYHWGSLSDAPDHPNLTARQADGLCITDFPAGVLRQGMMLQVGTGEGQLLPGTYRYQSTSYDYTTNSHILTGDDRVNGRDCRLTLNYYENPSSIELTYGDPFDFSFHTYHGNVYLRGVYNSSDCGPNTGGLYRVGE